ncbi:16S rRNA (uracil(1498)-N(3))-methyltransferase [Nakamurella alba]|uniref:16S rRNA (uracil(1498)-N(3))-methyltransferase n=1 Tax=Nakamurella alba TaxID=2665158 RepID=UPI0012B6C21D
MFPGVPFFLADPLPAPGPGHLGGAEGRHAATVRRMRAGERLVLTDGRGTWAAAEVRGVSGQGVDLLVGAHRTTAAPTVRVTLVQALPKGERSDLVVDLATEAGVDALVPWAAQRCVARWVGDKAVKGAEKWRTVAREAAKQSRRTFVPTVAAPVGSAAVAELIRAADLALVLHEAATHSLPAVELPAAGELVLIVGPEGGISPEELELFTAEGAVATRLGPEVLRTSTAAAVALGALGALTDRWGSTS